MDWIGKIALLLIILLLLRGTLKRSNRFRIGMLFVVIGSAPVYYAILSGKSLITVIVAIVGVIIWLVGGHLINTS